MAKQWVHRLRNGAVLFAGLLWLMGTPIPVHAITANEIFEKIVPKVHPPRSRMIHKKPRVAKPIVKTPTPAIAIPSAKPKALPPLPPKPDTSSGVTSPKPRPKPANDDAPRASDAAVKAAPSTDAISDLAEKSGAKVDAEALASASVPVPPLKPANVAVAGSATLGAVLTPEDYEDAPLGDGVAVHPPEVTPEDDMPLPRAKPLILAAIVPPDVRPVAPESLAACSASLASLKISAEAEPPVSKGECGAPDPYAVTALQDGAVKLEPAATTNCEMTTMLSQWVAEKVQPAALVAFGTRVTALKIADSYSCRGRNQIVGAQLSEHAFMNAVDVGAFEIDGRWVTVSKGSDHTDKDTDFIQTIRHDACDIFLTVLGPGSDGYHEDHLHLDMRHRGKHGGTRYCH